MKPFPAKRILGRTLLLVCICLALVFSVSAEQELESDAAYCFSGGEFSCSLPGELEGVFICEVPDPLLCKLCLGERIIRAGDFLPQAELSSLKLQPCAQENSTAVVSYMAISEGRLGEEVRFTMQIKSAADEPPVAQDGTLETYKNIPNGSTLQAADPEGAPLTYTVIEQPKRGSVSVEADGSFVYTPKHNKVGEDSFRYTATDPAGNTSEPATVQIRILKPLDEATFSDMATNEQFSAMWLRNTGLYGGEVLAEKLCFFPDKTVTRGEFLVMSMQLAGLNPDIGLVTSGFSDQQDAPAWMQPYLVSAMRRGIVSGIRTEDGLVFRPNEPVTREQAAVMLAGALRLDSSEVFAPTSSAPVWAQSSVAALTQAGVILPDTDSSTLTRQQAASLLYRASTLG